MGTTNQDVVRLLKQGLNHYGLGDLEAAIAAWEEAQRLDPGHQAVRDYLETAYEEAGGRPEPSTAIPALQPLGEDDDTPRSLPEVEPSERTDTAPSEALGGMVPAAPGGLGTIDEGEPDTLVRGALDAYREGRLEQAWTDLEQAAEREPERLDLRAYQELIRNQLMGKWAREIGTRAETRD